MEQQQLRDSGIEQGKIFVGGLSWDTTDESFEKYFAQFGEVESVKIMKDPSTHKPRGFGFVTFKNPATVEEVFKIASHTLDNKKVDPKHATCKPPQPTQQQQQTFDKRIFIGGLPVDAKPGDVKAVFDDLHLKVSSVDIKFVGKADDNPTDNPKNRGFGFVDFEKEEHVTTACTEKYITINGKKVEIKKAIPRRTQKQDINPQYAANG
jgi:RNA recognition motif-containing protein